MTALSRKLPRAEQWAHQICVEMGKTVESIVQVGRLLLKAKGDLAHGEWGRMFDERLIPLSQRTANCYMSVASHPLISNSHHGANLPSSWRTLYELTKVPEPTLKRAINDGVITPDMERKAVSALIANAKPKVSTSVVDDNMRSGEWINHPDLVIDHIKRCSPSIGPGGPTSQEQESRQTWADPLEPSTQRVSDISEREADSAMALRQIKKLYSSLTNKHRTALKEWINERS